MDLVSWESRLHPFFFDFITMVFFILMNQQREQQQPGGGAAWPQSAAECAACWDFVLALREQFGLDEAGAVERAVGLLKREGRVVSAEVVLGCRPRRKGEETHVADIGRAIREKGFVEVCDGRELVLGLELNVGEGTARDDDDMNLAGVVDVAELRERLRLEVGVEVLEALFRKIIPGLPAAKWRGEERYLELRAGDRVECVSRRRPWDGVSDFVLSVVPGGGWVVRDEAGAALAVARGAIRILRADGRVSVLGNATVRAIHRGGQRGQLEYYQWLPGAGDWEYSFKRFVTFASMYAPGVTDHARASSLASLFGETRAAMSRRRVEIQEEYLEMGGRAGFEGMRRDDPRRGIKLGPRKGRE